MRLLRVFSNNLRKYRNASGLSQEAFANKAGLHRTYISALERGKRSIALDNIEKIANALGIDAYPSLYRYHQRNQHRYKVRQYYEHISIKREI